ncbi:hypothetical protein [Maritimibacter alkaliphilus]|uniref:hypothetical protein n=1 Tax=Maritimibacter alkaliphilus TaxID=404236 RepID=UPI001C9782B6|nr:hypothetical protein [Maritimibacter alkaliphilus]MBY6091048.1 hypothetical protein [Maritimibacter alkaliphilus]
MTNMKSGRPPVHERKPSRQDIWEAIVANRDGFTITLLKERSLAHVKTIRDYLQCLIAADYVARDESSDQITYRLLRDGGHHAPRLRKDGTPVTQGAGTENMWRSMYMLKEFTHEDIALYATTSTVQVSGLTAKAYVQQLLRCGYLQVITKAQPSKGKLAKYRLVRMNGPLPPKVQRIKRIYDPNTHEVFEEARV